MQVSCMHLLLTKLPCHAMRHIEAPCSEEQSACQLAL
jgi:hypothetical protein